MTCTFIRQTTFSPSTTIWSQPQRWLSYTGFTVTIQIYLHVWKQQIVHTPIRRRNFLLLIGAYTIRRTVRNIRITGFSQKNDPVLAELLKAIFDLNWHINSHGKGRILWPTSESAETDEDVWFTLTEQRRSRPHYACVQGARTLTDHNQHEN